MAAGLLLATTAQNLWFYSIFDAYRSDLLDDRLWVVTPLPESGIEHVRPGRQGQVRADPEHAGAVDQHVGPATPGLIEDVASTQQQHGGGC